MNISGTNWSSLIKLYQKHNWGRLKAALCFEADQFRNLVSMATDSSHSVIMGKTVLPLFLVFSSPEPKAHW